MAAAHAIAAIVADDELREEYIVPSVFNRDVAPAVGRGGRRRGRARAGAAGRRATTIGFADDRRRSAIAAATA